MDEDDERKRSVRACHHGGGRGVGREEDRSIDREGRKGGGMCCASLALKTSFTYGGEPRVDVGFVFGDLCELEGGAELDELGFVVLGDEGLGLGGPVPPGDDDGEPLLLAVLKGRALEAAVRVPLRRLAHEGALALHRPVGVARARHLHHAHHRLLAPHQCDVRRKLPVPLDELLRPIQRVDVPAVHVLLALAVRHLAVLLAGDGDAGVLGCEGVADDRVGAEVGLGDGALVGLGLHLPLLGILLVHRQDLPLRRARHSYQVLQVERVREVLHRDGLTD
mmetsp:Transcript_11768/g.29749  ORF Transcript_11768/g.29749 Transcript_11768/m.29749 type:complete len:279 (+) Transcript_11768:464-1300(+)